MENKHISENGGPPDDEQLQQISLLSCALLYLFVPTRVFAAQHGPAIVGVNTWYTPPGMSQQTMIDQLANNGVRTVRRALYAGSTDFTIQAFRRGIGTVAIVYPYIGSKAKPKKTWSDVPVSALTPQNLWKASNLSWIRWKLPG